MHRDSCRGGEVVRFVFNIQLSATALYLLIATAQAIVSALAHNPNGYYIAVHSVVPEVFGFFKTFTLPQTSALYTISVFEVLIFADIASLLARRLR